jgi:hypothetical protein
MKPLSKSALLLIVTGLNLQAGHLFTLHKEMEGAGVSVRVDGKPFATYVVNEANKPYLWPVYGPTGKAMTREFPMKEVAFESAPPWNHLRTRERGGRQLALSRKDRCRNPRATRQNRRRLLAREAHV